MYSWKTTRLVCMILLLLPLAHLVYLVSRDTVQLLDASPEAWQDEIEDYATRDAQTSLPVRPVVVVGGRRVKLWPGLNEALAPRPVLMRGLGDAIVEDITFNYHSLIGSYQPESVVLLPGTSEFFIRDSKSAEGLAAAIRELVELGTAYGDTQHFYVISPLKTPMRPQDSPTIDDAAQLLFNWAENQEQVEILEPNNMLAGADGTPNPGYFRADGMHLNEHGYLRLSVLLRGQMEADSLPQER